ncbi:MAG: glycosyltransferase [Bacteroidales bacterium]|jgi:glycosyltransferase involved in cell wall biosynthesis|nr:glycosyltransferase [Bacteroidales bacterium]
MKPKKIIVSVSNDLFNDQRVHRICNSLQSNNYEVLLIGRNLKNSQNIEPRNYQTKRFSLLFNKGILFYLSLNIRFFFFLLFTKTDVLLSNDLDTLLCNTLVAGIKRKKLYYDSHELFTEVPELENRLVKKKIWLFIEKICIRKTKISYTVCQPIADFYNQKYVLNMNIIRNLPKKKAELISFENRENFLIYQGVLNKERGIELLIEAMKYIPDYKLIIAGKGDLEKEFKDLSLSLNLIEKIIFTGNISIEKLHEYTSKAKLGFSIEQGKSLNYKYALPNKIFDYIQADVPVICANFPEMKKIVNTYNVGEIFYGNSAKELAELINNLLDNENKLKEYSENCKKTKAVLNWENEELKLLELYQ